MLTRLTLGRNVVAVDTATVSPEASEASAPCWRGRAGISGSAFLSAGAEGALGALAAAVFSSSTSAAGSAASEDWLPPPSLMTFAAATPAMGPPVAMSTAARGTLFPPSSVGMLRRCEAAARRARERSSDCSQGSREPRSLCKSNRLSSLHSACGVS